MKVLHLTECVGGGVPLAIATTIKSTPEVEHTVLWCQENNSLNLSNVRQIELPKSVRKRIEIVRQALRDLSPDILHVHSSWAGVYGRVLGWSPVIYQPHAFAFRGSNKPSTIRAGSWITEKFLSRQTAAYAVLSEDERKTAQRLNSRTPAYYIPNMPTLPVSKSTSRVLDWRPTIAMAGRISPQKDPKFYMKIAALSTRSGNRPYRFMWIGDGGMSEQENMRRLGIHITGWLNADKLTESLDSTDIYIHTAKYEGFPLSVLDAIARGCLVVAREIPALRQVGLELGKTPGEILQIVDRLTKDPEYAAKVRLKQERVLINMSREKQQAALMKMYGEVSQSFSMQKQTHKRAEWRVS